ncbi:hypothetical protein [Parasitella parasitica]|uniref:Uncharacterized protein n=1 Tax=Parasitella parasitica TaxID=35722 RepID=A0A0B7MZP2_9FUNG|nr:hypothetical protein [Parasitella parasitica]
MAVNGIIAVVCTHGVAKKLIDMKQGERHAHTLAALSSIAEEKEANGDERKMMVSYDIMCRVKDKLCREVPSMTNAILGTPVFHAYGHSMHCQCEFNLRYLQGAGLNDGEGIERFWSEFAEFTGLTRNMTEANRSLTLLCVARHLGEKKMANLGHFLVNLYQYALDLRAELRREFTVNGDEVFQLRKEWEEFAAGQRGIKDRLTNDGRSALLANRDSVDRYLSHCEMYYHFAAMSSSEEDISRARSLEMRRILAVMEEFEANNPDIPRPGSASDPAILLRREVVQNLTVEHLRALLRVSIYTIKQIKISLKGRTNKDASIRLTLGLNTEKKLAAAILKDLNAYLQEKDLPLFPPLPTFLQDEQVLRQYFGAGMSQRMMNLHLLDRADEEITRIKKISNGLPEYFRKRMNLLRENIADIADDVSLVGRGMKKYIESLLLAETLAMTAVVGKLQKAGLVLMVNDHVASSSSFNSNNDNDRDVGNDGEDEVEDEVEDEDEIEEEN